jgi:carboxymethylenebutenolidase
MRSFPGDLRVQPVGRLRMAAQAEIKAALAGKPNATVYSYPSQRHAFARHNGAHYNAAAASLANGRTCAFLHQQLR